MPVVLTYKFGKSNNFGLNFGLYYSMLFSAQEDIDVEFTSKYNEKHFGIEDGNLQIASNDYGLIFGFGYFYPIFDGHKKINIEIRYYYGLQNIDMIDHSDEKISNGNFSISAAILFSKIKKV
jgi:hypothetical protein